MRIPKETAILQAFRAPRILSYNYHPDRVRLRSQHPHLAIFHPNNPDAPRNPFSLEYRTQNRSKAEGEKTFSMEVFTHSTTKAVVRRWVARRVKVAIKRQMNRDSRAAKLKGHLSIHTFAPIIQASGEDVAREVNEILRKCQGKRNFHNAK